MKIIKTLNSMLLLLALSLSACTLPGQAKVPTQTPQQGDEVATSIALTLTAINIQAQQAVTQTPNVIYVTATSQPATSTPALTSTPPPTTTPFPTITPLPPTAKPIPCDRAAFVMDVTVRDGTNFSPGVSFVKTWRLQNNGSCTWNSSYALVFEGGNAMDGPVEVAFPGSVAPGQTVDLSVTLKSPSSSGAYQGYWKLRNASGARFGIGENAAGSFWVKITVGNTSTPGPSPTSSPVTSGSCQILEVGPTYGADFIPNATFDSRWKVKNISSTAWKTSEVDFKYLGGTKMYEKEAIYDLKAQVDPDGTIDLIVDSIAPASKGLYSMSWGLIQGNTTLCSMSVTIRVK